MDVRKADEMISFIDNATIELTDWEVDFIDSMINWVRRGDELTERQAQTLSKIYEKVKGDYPTEGTAGKMINK